jgi:hypothetical protein
MCTGLRKPTVNHHPPICSSMTQARQTDIELGLDEQTALIAGARDTEPVRGLTHAFYKYPARFSPAFARAAIHTLTQPGDFILDNHVGGGTTLVEALASGRHAIGVDISALAPCPDTPPAPTSAPNT